ncbi:uncharacterized protein CLUP02_10156 [Colletotrichum lupini]|uniref:Uncharacterized protein n=1 Tax=Colletotrichum lupini TaxID=145971 RepID=A0A9Q8SWD2_9PEZI|nr:uncharacterized protein CLUP02_10156 [Colletotrichum lupini]UQC84660.1 hypothetical protein CLUP02_10156 [Colletotrichum lupini]
MQVAVSASVEMHQTIENLTTGSALEFGAFQGKLLRIQESRSRGVTVTEWQGMGWERWDTYPVPARGHHPESRLGLRVSSALQGGVWHFVDEDDQLQVRLLSEMARNQVLGKHFGAKQLWMKGIMTRPGQVRQYQAGHVRTGDAPIHQNSTAAERPVGSGRVGGADTGGPFARLPGAVAPEGDGEEDMRILPEGWCVAHSVPQQDMDENATLKTGGKVELTRQ